MDVPWDTDGRPLPDVTIDVSGFLTMAILSTAKWSISAGNPARITLAVVVTGILAKAAVVTNFFDVRYWVRGLAHQARYSFNGLLNVDFAISTPSMLITTQQNKNSRSRNKRSVDGPVSPHVENGVFVLPGRPIQTTNTTPTPTF